jgi:hypothetical protein
MSNGGFGGIHEKLLALRPPTKGAQASCLRFTRIAAGASSL